MSQIEEQAVAVAEHEDLPEIRAYSDGLKKAANNLALVSLITRLHHWLSIFVEELTNENARDKSVINNIRILNHRIGKAPIPDEFFQDLVAVRDSIVHADTKIEWEFSGKKRRVADRYANVNSGEIEFTPSHLQEAIAKSVEQVKWYDARF